MSNIHKLKRPSALTVAQYQRQLICDTFQDLLLCSQLYVLLSAMHADGYLQAKEYAPLLEIQRHLNNYFTQIVPCHRVMFLLSVWNTGSAS